MCFLKFDSVKDEAFLYRLEETPHFLGCLFHLLGIFLYYLICLLLSHIFHPRFPGIRLRRDNWVSVRYAEALNSGKSSVTLQRTDRHGILDQKRADFQESL